LYGLQSVWVTPSAAVTVCCPSHVAPAVQWALVWSHTLPGAQSAFVAHEVLHAPFTQAKAPHIDGAGILQ
jgi:hypothetical protein